MALKHIVQQLRLSTELRRARRRGTTESVLAAFQAANQNVVAETQARHPRKHKRLVRPASATNANE